jgi:hypothetical protein
VSHTLAYVTVVVGMAVVVLPACVELTNAVVVLVAAVVVLLLLLCMHVNDVVLYVQRLVGHVACDEYRKHTGSCPGA